MNLGCIQGFLGGLNNIMGSLIGYISTGILKSIWLVEWRFLEEFRNGFVGVIAGVEATRFNPIKGLFEIGGF